MDATDNSVPCLPPEDHFDLNAHIDWVMEEIDAGRQQVPADSQIHGPAISISLGDATDLDPELLAALCGPEGLGGSGNPALNEAFAQDQPADVHRPGPVLNALTEQAFNDISALTDDQLTGALHATIRLANRAFYLQTVAIAEFTRRRAAQLEAAKANKTPRGCRPGEYPDLELAAELLITRNGAQQLMSAAADLITRLPCTLAGMATGTIDPASAMTIAAHTACLSRADAARADEVLAAAAPEIRVDTLARRAASLEMKLDPEAAKQRKEHAKNTSQRVEARPEFSGNASLSGRELPTADALASKANIDAIALTLRNAGLEGTLDHLRVLAFTDLTQSRNPLDRITAPQAVMTAGFPADQREHSEAAQDEAPDEAAQDEAAQEGPARYPRAPGAPGGGLTPFPALINLVIPAATLLGWGTTPGLAAGWGLTDPEDTKDIVSAASQHLRTRWCVTITDDSSEAAAHACARGPHPWSRHPSPADPDPPQDAAAQLHELLCHLGVTPGSFNAIAKGECGHCHAEDGYSPSRKLKHLIRARAQTCTAPGCAAQSLHADQDHVIPYPDGPTDECNLHAPCRAHHRAKQAPGWLVEQPEPGVIRWTLPNGRIHVTRPTVYDS